MDFVMLQEALGEGKDGGLNFELCAIIQKY